MKLSKKRVILLSAVILIALIVSTYFGIKKLHYDIRLANQRDANLMAENAGECMKEWCETQGLTPAELVSEYRSGRVYDVTEDGEGFAHFLHTDESLNGGLVYIGVNENDGAESLFCQWAWNDGRFGGMVGQYPDGVSYKEITEENNVSFGSYFQPKNVN